MKHDSLTVTRDRKTVKKIEPAIVSACAGERRNSRLDASLTSETTKESSDAEQDTRTEKRGKMGKKGIPVHAFTIHTRR